MEDCTGSEAGGFFSGGSKPTKNLGKPQVFRYLELLDPSRSVLAPMYPIGTLVGDVLAPFWLDFCMKKHQKCVFHPVAPFGVLRGAFCSGFL